MFPSKTLTDTILFFAVIGDLFSSCLASWYFAFRYIDVPTSIAIMHKFGLLTPAGVHPKTIENTLSIFLSLLGIVVWVYAGFYGNFLLSNKKSKMFIYLLALLGFLLFCYSFYSVTSQQNIFPAKNSILLDFAIHKSKLYFFLVSFLLLINFVFYRLKFFGNRLCFFAYSLFFLFLFSFVLTSNIDDYVANTHFDVFVFPIV